jgi:trk system potassium uptake protein
MGRFSEFLAREKTMDLMQSRPIRALRHIPFLLSFLGFSAVVYDYGFNQTTALQQDLDVAYIVLLLLEIGFITIRYIFRGVPTRFKVWAFDAVFVFGLLMTAGALTGMGHSAFFTSHYWVSFVFLLVLLREMSSERIEFKRSIVNPALLFVSSFLMIILMGTFALMFPNATTHGISFVDALFTSGSAVCVTGLSVVDTGTCFTTIGQVIIMILIQLGGLGIMTFTSYFSYFFTGESSYENQLLIQEMTSSNRFSDVFGTLKRVLLLTFTVEMIGAVCVFMSISDTLIPGFWDRFFFSIFHAISSFCNAGFSTLSNNLYELDYRFNYPFHLTVAFLIIFGGLGFPILFNFFQYVKHLFRDQLFRKQQVHMPWVINLNTRIVLITTLVLLVGGTGLFYFFEYDNTLAEHGSFGKIVTAFFGAVTPRTAGFNSVDNSQLHLTTVMLIYFLMWVGGSPASTAGGIKTSTLAVSVMNAFGLARGKDRIDLFKREISDSTLRRAYAQIFLSIIGIGLSVFFVAYFDSYLGMKNIIFECISAFGTVGLTLGITTKLSAASKLVITLTMFVGRVSLLSIMASFMRQVKTLKYRYPKEDLTIN